MINYTTLDDDEDDGDDDGEVLLNVPVKILMMMMMMMDNSKAASLIRASLCRFGFVPGRGGRALCCVLHPRLPNPVLMRLVMGGRRRFRTWGRVNPPEPRRPSGMAAYAGDYAEVPRGPQVAELTLTPTTPARQALTCTAVMCIHRRCA